jgi:Ran GTPase-activating protein (RanGAP) involved in mRNA processing and transport
MNINNLDHDELNREMVLELFYTTKGNLNKINQAIDEKLKIKGSRKITLFEEFIKNRLLVNRHILKMPQLEISSIETIYLCQYPSLEGLKILDLRKNFIGDEGLEAISSSPLLSNLRELDLRNNGITRLGVKLLSESKLFGCLEKIDLRINKLGKRWEEKLYESGNFPNLRDVKTV